MKKKKKNKRNNNTKNNSKKQQNLMPVDNVKIEQFNAIMRDYTSLYHSPHHQGVEYPQKKVRFSDLRWLASEVPLHHLIKNKRADDLIQYGTPQSKKDKKGFVIELRDPEQQPDKQDLENIKQLNYFMQHLCFENYKDEIPGFETRSLTHFLKMIVDDTLTIDANSIEIIRNVKGDVIGFQPIDAAAIRRTTEYLRKEKVENKPTAEGDPIRQLQFYVHNPRYKEERIDFVQVLGETIVAEFRQKDLVYSYMNPRTDSRFFGYGYSYFEMAVQVATSFMYAFEYNKSQFRHDKLPRGILAVQGIDDGMADKIQRYIHGIMNQVGGRWKVPVMPLSESGKEIQWINFNNNNKEMEFYKFLSILTAIYAAIYDIDLAELGLKFQETQPVVSNEAAGDKIQYSKDTGMLALLTHAESVLNEVLRKITDRYVLRFVGFEVENEKEILEIKKREIETHKSVNDIRKERDEEPYEFMLKVGDKEVNIYDIPAVANQQIFQLIQAQVQNAQQEAMMDEGQEGMEDGGGEEISGEDLDMDSAEIEGGEENQGEMDVSEEDFDLSQLEV